MGFRHEKGIQIVTGSAGRHGEPAGIDKVRAFFKGGHLIAFLSPGGCEPQGNNRFAGTSLEG